MNEHRMPDAVHGLSGRMRRKWSGTTSGGRLRALSGKAEGTAKRAARAMRSSAREADGYVRHTVGGRPLVAISVALGVGFLLGRMSGRR